MSIHSRSIRLDDATPTSSFLVRAAVKVHRSRNGERASSPDHELLWPQVAQGSADCHRSASGFQLVAFVFADRRVASTDSPYSIIVFVIPEGRKAPSTNPSRGVVSCVVRFWKPTCEESPRRPHCSCRCWHLPPYSVREPEIRGSVDDEHDRRRPGQPYTDADDLPRHRGLHRRRQVAQPISAAEH